MRREPLHIGPYREAPPPPGLERWIRTLWRYEASPSTAPPPHRVLPCAAPSLAFTRVRGVDGHLEMAALEVLGPIHHPRTYRPGPGSVVEAVQLHPHWSRSLLGLDGSEQVDRVGCAVEAGVPGARALLGEARAAAESGRDTLPVLLRWIGGRVEALDQGSAEWLAHAALARLEGPKGGAARVAEVAAALGVSTRHLRRAVGGLTGTPPKLIQRLARLDAVVSAADGGEAPAWSRLALRMGYSDQPHLIHEVRELTGLTPAALRRERRGEHVRFLQSPASPPS